MEFPLAPKPADTADRHRGDGSAALGRRRLLLQAAGLALALLACSKEAKISSLQVEISIADGRIKQNLKWRDSQKFWQTAFSPLVCDDGRIVIPEGTVTMGAARKPVLRANTIWQTDADAKPYTSAQEIGTSLEEYIGAKTARADDYAKNWVAEQRGSINAETYVATIEGAIRKGEVDLPEGASAVDALRGVSEQAVPTIVFAPWTRREIAEKIWADRFSAAQLTAASVAVSLEDYRDALLRAACSTDGPKAPDATSFSVLVLVDLGTDPLVLPAEPRDGGADSGQPGDKAAALKNDAATRPAAATVPNPPVTDSGRAAPTLPRGPTGGPPDPQAKPGSVHPETSDRLR